MVPLTTTDPVHREYFSARLEVTGAVLALAVFAKDAALEGMAKRLAIGLGEVADDADFVATMRDAFPPVEQIDARLAHSVNHALTRYIEAVEALRRWSISRQ